MHVCIFCIKQKDTISGLTNNTFDVIVPYLLSLQETELAEGEEKPFNAFLLRVILNSVREISFTYYPEFLARCVRSAIYHYFY